MGGQRDSNPQQPESQSGALPLSYGHRRGGDCSFRARDCKGKARCGTPRALSLWRAPSLQLHGARLSSALPRMKKIGLILLAGFSLLATPLPVAAQSDDPSEVFLKAYMTSQQGEKLEHDNQFKAALTKFRFAGSLLEELRKGHADWQPAIVDYRARKIGESILRVQGKIGSQADLAAASEPAPPEP